MYKIFFKVFLEYFYKIHQNRLLNNQNSIRSNKKKNLFLSEKETSQVNTACMNTGPFWAIDQTRSLLEVKRFGYSGLFIIFWGNIEDRRETDLFKYV